MFPLSGPRPGSGRDHRRPGPDRDHGPAREAGGSRPLASPHRLGAHPSGYGPGPGPAGGGVRRAPVVRGHLPNRRQLHPEPAHAGPGGDRYRPRHLAPVEPVPVQRHAPAGRIQCRRRLPGHVAHRRPAAVHRVDAHPGGGLRPGPGRDVRLPAPPAALGHRRHLRRRHLRLRRLHDRAAGAHRPHRGGGLAPMDPGLGARPHRRRQPPIPPVGRPSGGGPDSGRWCWPCRSGCPSCPATPRASSTAPCWWPSTWWVDW